ncbi:MAG: PQQ-binding-like beta-propeller repeat protein [Rubripirellula sp.]
MGRVNDTHIVWRETLGTPGVPSPLYVDRKLYTFKNSSLGFLRDASTGDLLSRSRIGRGSHYYSSPITGDGKVYIASSDGVVAGISTENELQVLARNDLGEQLMATSAIADGVLLSGRRRRSLLFRLHDVLVEEP